MGSGRDRLDLMLRALNGMYYILSHFDYRNIKEDVILFLYSLPIGQAMLDQEIVPSRPNSFYFPR